MHKNQFNNCLSGVLAVWYQH